MVKKYLTRTAVQWYNRTRKREDIENRINQAGSHKPSPGGKPQKMDRGHGSTPKGSGHGEGAKVKEREGRTNEKNTGYGFDGIEEV